MSEPGYPITEAPARVDSSGVVESADTPVDSWINDVQGLDEEFVRDLRPVMLVPTGSPGPRDRSTVPLETITPGSLEPQGQRALEAQVHDTVSMESSYPALLPSQSAILFDESAFFETVYKPAEMAEMLLEKNYLPTQIFGEDANPWYQARWFQFFDHMTADEQISIKDVKVTESWLQEEPEFPYEAWFQEALGRETVTVQTSAESDLRQTLRSLDYGELLDRADDAGIENPAFLQTSELIDKLVSQEA